MDKQIGIGCIQVQVWSRILDSPPVFLDPHIGTVKVLSAILLVVYGSWIWMKDTVPFFSSHWHSWANNLIGFTLHTGIPISIE